jgi:hypothetical protein
VENVLTPEKSVQKRGGDPGRQGRSWLRSYRTWPEATPTTRIFFADAPVGQASACHSSAFELDRIQTVMLQHNRSGEPVIEGKYAPKQRLFAYPKKDDVTSGSQKSVSERL